MTKLKVQKVSKHTRERAEPHEDCLETRAGTNTSAMNHFVKGGELPQAEGCSDGASEQNDQRNRQRGTLPHQIKLKNMVIALVLVLEILIVPLELLAVAPV